MREVISSSCTQASESPNILFIRQHLLERNDSVWFGAKINLMYTSFRKSNYS